MSRRRIAAVLIVGAALAGAVMAQPPSTPPATSPPPVGVEGAGHATPNVPARIAYATTLPDSAGRAVVERWCLMCHSATLITQQAKDSTAWEKTLAQMEKWGVTTTPEERDTLRAYLVMNFGPRVVPVPAPSAARDTARAPAQSR
jgi:cytochrome c5